MRGGVGGVATPNSFAWINASWGNPEPYFRLRIRAMAEWRRLASAVPDVPLAWTGGLCFDLPQAELETYADEHGAWGYGIKRVGRAEASQIEPSLVDPPSFALHVAEEGVVEPALAAQALLADAERRGARLRLRTVANSLIEKAGRIAGIETAAGPIAADEIVLAAGAGTAALAVTAGIDIRMATPPGLLVHSRRYSRMLNGVVLAPELHMRQTAEGRIVSGSDFGGADPGDDADAAARDLFAKTRAMLRGGDTLEMDFHTVGYRPTPADGFPIIGRVEGRPGLTLAVMHSGITLAPAVGRSVADELLTDRRDPLLEPYRLARFRHLAQPDHGGGEAEHREERQRSLVVARGDAAVVLDFVDEAFDAVAQLVGFSVVGGSLGAAGAWRDDDRRAGGGEIIAQGARIEALVADHADQRQAVEEGDRLRHLVHLASREDYAQRIAERIDGDVDLGAEATARAAEGVIASPPFAPAACWCARTMVASIITCRKSGSSAKALKRLSQTPFLAQRRKRTYTLFQLPNSG